jgi:hypothetical protein
MEVAGLDGHTITGANSSLDDPMATALEGMNFSHSEPVIDADLVQVSDSIPEFLDRAELRTLENIAGNLDLVDIGMGPRRESLSQLAAQVELSIQRLTTKIQREYGGGVGTLSAGVVSLAFAATNDTDADEC